ncbi:aromatic amino acid hydroxylase [Aureibacter tunicatorum]|uniref:Phenylalanine-4-hydroxylase n=1 Tax=Aureibacter tunicatorum TaxID=866807 RepID=A0AAE3XKF4_9BACT|nr:aromatic amino acid hydroxylase [Aureibacter tunicatorum]MDR6238263.1 phenylalanine-4-hydroxylase [Aureibacter tunicatorum]BDD03296.1 phenylalanine 4-monooxygenase [Aureibacter tunicatorum]
MNNILSQKEIKERLPLHLQKFVIDQSYDSYTELDHAKWRYVMRMTLQYASDYAHEFFLPALKKMNLPIDRIPRIEQVNNAVNPYGWNAVCINAFITTKTFLEFHSEKILVVATCVRTLQHLKYTPYPDLIHDILGHGPCVAFSPIERLMRYFGKLGTRAFSSRLDSELHDALNKLSILKEEKSTNAQEINQVSGLIDYLKASFSEVSEMEKVRRLHWYTLEYGLVGSLGTPKIYGAGLLSSIGESYKSLSHDVEKRPYTLGVYNDDFDPTQHQKKLNVIKDFESLEQLLEEFAARMAISTGGVCGLGKLIDSKDIGTLELDHLLQITGEFANMISFEGKPVYIESRDRVVLSVENQMLKKASKVRSPLGIVIQCVVNDAFKDLKLLHQELKSGDRIELHYDSGMSFEGNIENTIIHQGVLLVIEASQHYIYNHGVKSLEGEGCTLLFGNKVNSVYAGVVDKNTFEEYEPIVSMPPLPEHSVAEKKHFVFYKELREMRLNHSIDLKRLKEIFNASIENAPKDWLIILELYELIGASNDNFKDIVKNKLLELAKNDDYRVLIEKGLALRIY